MIKGKNAVFLDVGIFWFLRSEELEFQKKTPSWLSNQSHPATSFLLKRWIQAVFGCAFLGGDAL